MTASPSVLLSPDEQRIASGTSTRQAARHPLGIQACSTQTASAGTSSSQMVSGVSERGSGARIRRRIEEPAVALSGGG